MKCACLTFILALGIGEACAEELPLWEVGLGFAGLSIPNYRGSAEHKNYFLPLPYVVYRGDYLAIDRDGIHSHLVESNRMDLTFSLGAGVPAKSDDGVRAGMPDIDPTIEVGPKLTILLTRNRQYNWTCSLDLPLRAVAATNFKRLDSIGWVFSPHLKIETSHLGSDQSWSIDFSVGPLYASERYHDYYYEVAPVFATSTRPAYNASGGYSGSRMTFTLSRRHERYWFGAFMRYDRISGAVFDDSPLVERDDAFMAGVGIAWIFARSDITVHRTSALFAPPTEQETPAEKKRHLVW